MALFGALVYLVSQVVQLDSTAASRLTRLATATLATWPPVASGAGLVLLFSGTVVALWRVNRLAGRTAAGAAGFVGGALGVLVLAALDVVGLFGALGLHSSLLSTLASLDAVGQLAGTFLALASLAMLGLGLSHALWISGPAPAEAAADARSDLGSAGYRSY